MALQEKDACWSSTEQNGLTAHPAPQLDHDLLQRCVEALNECERTVVVMSFYDEWTGADVASFLDISEANVRMIRRRVI